MADNQIKLIVEEIANTKQIPVPTVVKAFEEAMQKAYSKEFPEEVCEVTIDLDSGKINLHKIFDVVENNKQDLNEYFEITLDEAKKKDPSLKVGDKWKEKFDIQSLERRVVLHMLQVFKHGVVIESNKNTYHEWISKKGSVIYAEVEKYDAKAKVATINLGKTFGFMPKVESNPEDKFLIPGKKYKFVIKDVLQQSKGWPIVLSRADGGIIKDLLSVNIPEIENKQIDIIQIARVAGFKSKVVVKSNVKGLDPVGACIGTKADRIKAILEEMGNEKIEFIEYDENIGQFIANCANPAVLYGYTIIPAKTEKDEQTGVEKEIERKKIILVIDQYKLALLIGLKGNNVKLLSQLLNADVDVISIEDAEEYNLTITKAPMPKHSISANGNKTAKAPSKFSSAYNKYHGDSTMDIINQMKDFGDNEEPVIENAKQEESDDKPILDVDTKNLDSFLEDIEKQTSDAHKKNN